MPAAPTGPRARVLVVDDEPAICRALVTALTRAGFDAASVTTGEGAHDYLTNHHADLLLLDLRMPDLRGDVVFHLATALQPHLATATVFVTGDITERADEIIAECRCPVIRKPFDLMHVVATLRTLAPREIRSQAAS